MSDWLNNMLFRLHCVHFPDASAHFWVICFTHLFFILGSLCSLSRAVRDKCAHLHSFHSLTTYPTWSRITPFLTIRGRLGTLYSNLWDIRSSYTRVLSVYPLNTILNPQNYWRQSNPHLQWTHQDRSQKTGNPTSSCGVGDQFSNPPTSLFVSKTVYYQMNQQSAGNPALLSASTPHNHRTQQRMPQEPSNRPGP